MKDLYHEGEVVRKNPSVTVRSGMKFIRYACCADARISTITNEFKEVIAVTRCPTHGIQILYAPDEAI